MWQAQEPDPQTTVPEYGYAQALGRHGASSAYPAPLFKKSHRVTSPSSPVAIDLPPSLRGPSIELPILVLYTYACP